MEQSTKSSGDYWVPIGSPFLTNLGGRPIPTDAQLMLEYLTNDLAYTCANWNAAAVARVRLRLYAQHGPDQKHRRPFPARPVEAAELRRLKGNPNLAGRLARVDDIEEITDHPIINLLERDNDGLNGYQLRYMTGVYMEVFGGAYWLLEPGLFEPVRQIKILPTQRVMPLRDNDLAVVGYKYMPALQGNWLTLAKNNVLDFRFPAVEDPYGGRHAPLRSAYMQAELASKYSMYQNELLDNRARIDGTFVPQEHITRQESRRAEELWNQKFKRGGNGRILVAEQAGTFVPARYPPTDLGPLKISQESLKRLANAFGVPEALLSKDSTYANMQASLTLYARNTILPRVLILEQKLNEMLVSRYGPRLFLAAENPVPADEAFELEKVQIAIQAGVLSPDEIRTVAGFKPLQGGNTYTNPSRQAGQITAAPATATATTADPGPPEGNAPGGSAASAAVKLLVTINRAVATGKLRRSVAINLLMRELGMDAAQARRLIGRRRKRPRLAPARVSTEIKAGPSLVSENPPPPPPHTAGDAATAPQAPGSAAIQAQTLKNSREANGECPDDTQIV